MEPDKMLAALKEFPALEQGPKWLKQKRARALELFSGLPTTKAEDWLYTNLSALENMIQPMAANEASSNLEAAIAEAKIADLDCYQIVFLNGQFLAQHSSFPTVAGLEISNINAAIQQQQELVSEHLGSTLKQEDYPFQALNSILMDDGLFLHLQENVALDKPLHLIFISDSSSAALVSPRSLVLLDAGAKATLIETHLEAEGSSHTTNSVLEIIAAAGAEMQHYQLLNEGSESNHLATTAVIQEEDSDFNSFTAVLSGRLCRNDVLARLQGKSANCTINGVHYLQGNQQADTFTRLEHIATDCTSNQLFKGVMADSSRTVFDGRIFVDNDAQRTDAVQTNRNMLLSDEAVAYAKPQLEIYADDVKCTHAATTGQLNPDESFYLRSRGFSPNQAQAMLTFAFVGEVLEEIKQPEIKAKLVAELSAAFLS
jgi:Fe-S cluster assembly protein SufD